MHPKTEMQVGTIFFGCAVLQATHIEFKPFEYPASTALDEKARVVELNSKLHELCRELRKENALLLDTSKAISAQELSQRKALTENFQVTVSGITVRYASSPVGYVAPQACTSYLISNAFCGGMRSVSTTMWQ